MTTDSLLQTAEAIARKAHDGQFRRDGITPYISHPERVVARLKVAGFAPHVLAAGWLHDVVEDSDWTIEDLTVECFPDEVLSAVQFLTRDFDDYKNYLSNIQHDQIAREVKIADILDNLSDAPTDKQIVKYCKALLFLHGK